MASLPYVSTGQRAESIIVEWQSEKNSPRAFVGLEQLAKQWNVEIKAEQARSPTWSCILNAVALQQRAAP